MAYHIHSIENHISLDKTTSILYPIKIQKSNLILLHKMPGRDLGIFFLSHWWTIWNKPIRKVDILAIYKRGGHI